LGHCAAWLRDEKDAAAFRLTGTHSLQPLILEVGRVSPSFSLEPESTASSFVACESFLRLAASLRQKSVTLFSLTAQTLAQANCSRRTSRMCPYFMVALREQRRFTRGEKLRKVMPRRPSHEKGE